MNAKGKLASSRTAPAVLLVVTLAGCGGGGDGDSAGQPQPPPPPPPPPTATGAFKDANVSGLSYVSGGQTGQTTASGAFTYEVGQSITFRVGGVTLGTAPGRALLTPLDLVANGAANDVGVQNRVRFLLMLDADGNPANGIEISDSVRARAAQWPQVDFSTADLPAALATIVADARSADGGAHVLPDAAAARGHFEGTLRCTRAGAFRGTYAGDDRGVFGMLVLASNNNILTLVFSEDDEFRSIVGTQPITLDQQAAFFVGSTVAGSLTYGGRFTQDTVSGNWSTGPQDGTFSGTRIGGAANAVHRFTGAFAGDDAGLFSFDVAANGQITGVAYSLLEDVLLNLTGTLAGSSLTVSASNGATASGTANTATGQLNGTWTNPTGGDGNFIGDGCRLN